MNDKTPEMKPENPPAFPRSMEATQYGDWQIHDYGDHGMTLRDYFAAKAMQAVISNIVVAKNADGEYLRNVADVALLAYKQADAMLKARAA